MRACDMISVGLHRAILLCASIESVVDEEYMGPAGDDLSSFEALQQTESIDAWLGVSAFSLL